MSVDPRNLIHDRIVYRHMFVFAVALLIVWVLWTTWDAIVPYLIGFLLAYLLMPVVGLLERHIPGGEDRVGLRRGVAVLIVYIVFFGALTLLLITIGEKVVNETAELMDDIDQLYTEAVSGDTRVQQWYQDNVPTQFQQQIEQNLDENGASFADWIKTPLTNLVGSVSGLLGMFFTLFFIPLFMLYLLIERPSAATSMGRHIPEAWRKDLAAISHILNTTVFSYFRGLTMEGLLLGTATGLVLWLMGVEYALALGFVTGLAVFIPYVGFWFAFLATIGVVQATDPSLLIPVMIVTGILQLIDNWYLAPRFKGGAVGFSPAQTLFMIAIGAGLWGAVGVIVIMPIVAVFRDTVLYIYNRLTPEDETELAVAVAAIPVSEPEAVESDET